MINIDYNSNADKFIIQCPVPLNNVVRALPNRRFVKKLNAWSAPAIRANCRAIEGWTPEYVGSQVAVSDGAKARLEEARTQGKRVPIYPFPSWYKHKLPPLPDQADALNTIYSLDKFMLAMEMGTGKSKVYIDKACVSIMEDKADALVLLCPVSTTRNFIEEIHKHSPIDFDIFVMDNTVYKIDAKARDFTEAKSDKPKAMIFGIESFSGGERKGKAFNAAMDFMAKYRCVMIVDESHMIKGHNSTRSINIVKHLGPLAAVRGTGTGTPIANNLMDAYMQYEFLDTEIIGIGDFYSYRNRYAEMGGFQNKQIVGYDNVEELMELIRPFTVVKKLKLSIPLVEQKRYVSLSKAQKDMYNSVKKDKVLGLDVNGDHEVLLDNCLQVYLALQQTTSGFITASRLDDPEVRDVVGLVDPTKSSKIVEMMQAVSELPDDAQVIIWSRFRYEIAAASEALRKAFGHESVSEYHGGLTPSERDDERLRFKSGKSRFFVSNQVTGGTGLTLNEAKYSIYLSKDFNYVTHKQSVHRNYRTGQDQTVVHISIIAEGTVDTDIENALANKQDLSDYVKSRLATDPASVISGL